MEARQLDPKALRECVVIYAPTGQDALLLQRVLAKEGIVAEICDSRLSLLKRLAIDAGAVMIAEEALTREAIQSLNLLLNAQEPWSDIPLVVMTSGGETTLASMRVLKAFNPVGNITLLERPFRPITLVSALQVALRARRRQYQVRDLLIRQAEDTRMRDEFISIASHELKTPLTSLKLQAQLNRRMIETDNPESYSKRRVDKLVESTEKQVDRLARLVEDMLDISRIATGKLAMQLEAVDLGELTLEVVDRLRSQVESVDSTLEIDIESKLIGNWDRYRIEQVISNLLMNAVRYSPGTPLYVSAKRVGAFAQLKVRDEGPGIAPENQERIFQRFERAVNASSLTGLGLGLYICREILESHRGTITVESALGQGALFTVNLPLA